MRRVLSIDVKILTVPASSRNQQSNIVDERDNPSQLIHREYSSMLIDAPDSEWPLETLERVPRDARIR